MKTIATIATNLFIFLFLTVSMPVHAHYHTDTGWKTTYEPEKAIYVQDRIRVLSEPDSIELSLYVSLMVHCGEDMVAIETEGFITRYHVENDSLQFGNETYLTIRFDDEKDTSIEVERESDTLLYIHYRNISKFLRDLKKHKKLRIWLRPLLFDGNYIMARFDISGYEQAYRNHCW